MRPTSTEKDQREWRTVKMPLEIYDVFIEVATYAIGTGRANSIPEAVEAMAAEAKLEWVTQDQQASWPAQRPTQQSP